MLITAIILGALFNRIRGGLYYQYFPEESQPRHVVWDLINAIAFGLFCGALQHSWLTISCAATGMFVGSSFGWGKYLNPLVERKDVGDNLSYAGQRGVVWTACIAFTIGNPYIIPAGLLFGLCYYLATYLTTTPQKAWAYGEYIWGAILWGTVATVY